MTRRRKLATTKIKSTSRRNFLKTVAALLGQRFVGIPTFASVQMQNKVIYMWSGALTPTSAKVKARLNSGINVQLSVRESDQRKMTISAANSYLNNHYVASFELRELKPNTTYEYRVEAVDGTELEGEVGRFKTPHEGMGTFKVAFGNCCDSGTDSTIFLDILNKNPLFFIQIGDLHYENIVDGNRERFQNAYEKVLASTVQGEMYRQVPSVYIWDDHDFGGDNSDKNSRSASTAQNIYREAVPHHSLPKRTGAIYHSFAVGRVKFIVSDCRSEKSPSRNYDDHRKSMLGEDQKRWLKSEFIKGKKQHSLIVWINPLPWISNSDVDTWAGYQTEREEIATFIEDNNINNMVMLGGDAHVLAMDDGENNRYGAKSRKLFPIFHAGPLDSIPKNRGGPYGQIADLKNGHYGTMEITDDETGVFVSWKGYYFNKNTTPGRSKAGSKVMSLDLEFPAAKNLDPILDQEIYLPIASNR